MDIETEFAFREHNIKCYQCGFVSRYGGDMFCTVCGGVHTELTDAPVDTPDVE